MTSHRCPDRQNNRIEWKHCFLGGGNNWQATVAQCKRTQGPKTTQSITCIHTCTCDRILRSGSCLLSLLSLNLLFSSAGGGKVFAKCAACYLPFLCPKQIESVCSFWLDRLCADAYVGSFSVNILNILWYCNTNNYVNILWYRHSDVLILLLAAAWAWIVPSGQSVGHQWHAQGLGVYDWPVAGGPWTCWGG